MSATPNTVPLREIDYLDRAIVDPSTRIKSETYELLVLVREFDERAGWLKWETLLFQGAGAGAGGESRERGSTG